MFSRTKRMHKGNESHEDLHTTLIATKDKPKDSRFTNHWIKFQCVMITQYFRVTRM